MNAAFIPLVPLASSGRLGVLQPDVDALHEVAGDVQVVVLEEHDAASKLRLAAPSGRPARISSLPRLVRGVGLAREDDLNRPVLAR